MFEQVAECRLLRSRYRDEIRPVDKGGFLRVDGTVVVGEPVLHVLNDGFGGPRPCFQLDVAAAQLVILVNLLKELLENFSPFFGVGPEGAVVGVGGAAFAELGVEGVQLLL